MKAFMSIDVEDWFHTANFQNIVKRDQWDHQTPRVEQNTHKILDIFDSVGIKSTFFVLGWVAKKYPSLVPEIANRGHEVASHGTHHELVYEMSGKDFRKDIRYSKKILEDQSGNKVLGYRAPNFSITDQAIDILQEEGFQYDSSVFPTVFHDRYGILSKYEIRENGFYEIKKSFFEFPLSSFNILGVSLPWSGGAYFRVIPIHLFIFGFKKIIQNEGYFNFYLHPWEIDHKSHGDTLLTGYNKFRQSVNLSSTEKKLKKLIPKFEFQPISTLLKNSNN